MTRAERAERMERARFRVYAGLGAVALLALLSFAVMALAAVPYSPLSVRSYEPTVREACPGEPVRVVVDSEVEDGAEIRSIEVQPEWVAVDVPEAAVGQVVEGPQNTLPPGSLAPGRRVAESRVVRPAPLQPGVWRHGAEITVRGSLYGIPRPQTLTVRSEKTTAVLPADHPGCRGQGTPTGGF